MWKTLIIRFFFMFYRYFLSPLFWAFGARCRFEPSCSAYAEKALYHHGFLYGSFLALGRLIRCQPFCSSGHDPVPLEKKVLFRRFRWIKRH